MSALTFAPSQPKRQPFRSTPAPAPPPTRILVVDEDEDLRLFYTDVLTPSGYHVAAAEEGAGAWQALATQRFDLLITGNQRPSGTGVDLLKKLDGARTLPPVILISRRVPAVEWHRHPPLKVAAILFLPHTGQELVEMVHEVLTVSGAARNPLAPGPKTRAKSGTTAISLAGRNRRWDLI